jgi:NAD(P)-dependent dehydrogenase (short-subunit alcohol dehydrogenase family)
MGDLDGQSFVVTGANTGIGKVTARELAKRGARVILACRSAEKTEPVINEIAKATGNSQVEFAALDLGDLASVRKCAQGLIARDKPIHVLINNAGLAGTRGTTTDGFELAFGVNHLGPYLLTRLLLDHLRRSGPSPRVVNVASKAHYRPEAIDWDALQKKTKAVTGFPEYGVSKLANVLFTRELAKRAPDIATYAVHPGVVASDVWRKVPPPFRWIAKRFMITVEEGAKTSLYCATTPVAELTSGAYYDECKERRPSKLALDDDLARTLWDKSATWVGLPA